MTLHRLQIEPVDTQIRPELGRFFDLKVASEDLGKLHVSLESYTLVWPRLPDFSNLHQQVEEIVGCLSDADTVDLATSSLRTRIALVFSEDVSNDDDGDPNNVIDYDLSVPDDYNRYSTDLVAFRQLLLLARYDVSRPVSPCGPQVEGSTLCSYVARRNALTDKYVECEITLPIEVHLPDRIWRFVATRHRRKECFFEMDYREASLRVVNVVRDTRRRLHQM